MFFADKVPRKLGFAALGIMGGCIVAWTKFFIPHATIVYFFPLIIAILVGGAKTTTA